VRAFFGVGLPALDSLRGLVEDLRRTGADYKLVAPENFHLTIRFLGEIPDAQAGPILEAVRAIPRPAPFEVTVEDVGAFPDWKKLNILWAGIKDPAGGLTRLHLETERALNAIGLTGEGRPYSAHLTLGRKRSDRGRDAVRAVLTARRGADFGTATIDRLTLYESTLTREGPIYKPFGEVPL
jgi:2'-5' RNA ligase